MELISRLIEDYAAAHTDPEGGLLEEISRSTLDTHPEAHMLSGQVQGKFLQIISKMIRPRFVLDIGTFTGYSAICLAAGLTRDGELHTIEIREEEAELAKANFNRSDQRDRIILHRGNALTIIPALNKAWDLVFLDADKTGYIDYYKMVMPFVRKGGILLADNVLFHGQVLQESLKGKNAKAIQAFNDFVNADDSVEKVLLTIRDGLLMIRKK